MTQNHALPPLIGDEQGRYRIRVLGNSGSPLGSGKSTVSKELGSILNLPVLSLDETYWQPGWKTTPAEEFREKIEEFMQQNTSRGWVIDGDYGSKGGFFVQECATDVIWLNPPLLLYFPRIAFRTFLRLVGLHPPCRPGCPETIREVFFSKDSIIWWCLSQHRVNIKRNSALMKIWGLGMGSRARKMRRLDGWGAETRNWLENVRELARSQ
ncbi:hypothetical protein GYMLUDRAFT_833154 [Collybiopsis luxurians FD-317 M1]|uniref:Adenylate kinase n=1 Tax=Collybiopsis luxurians FD-317 M1 TaxID=944289 RepID=A0A0D0BLI4_9AGAR|nr:hypothetical protein GYMLUDRAFT_833154 [Collybiopsis luxurians FD-317 M1]